MNDRNLRTGNEDAGAAVRPLRPILLGTAMMAVAASLAACGSAGPGDGDGTPGAGSTTQGIGGGFQGVGGNGTASGSSSGTGNGPGVGGATLDPTPPGTVLDRSGQIIQCGELVRPPTPLRRLTRFEYDNSVRDLLGTTQTPSKDFPPDEVDPDGFGNNALILTVSGLHAEKYTYAAEALAQEAVTKLESLLPCDPATGEESCAEAFAKSFGRRAFRRALEPEDVAALMTAYGFGESFPEGIEIMIRAALLSPHFLYRVEFSGARESGNAMVRLNGYETASRLAFLLWSAGPDDALLDAAAAGELDTPQGVAVQARRLLADERARTAALEFYRQWLDLNRLGTISGKDPAEFPLWSDALKEATKTAMVTEANKVIESVVFSSDASLTRLLTAPLGVPTGPLATLYGVPESNDVISLPAGERSGVLTLPGFLSVQSHPDQTSPVLRGKFIRTKLLCGQVEPPPDDIDTSTPNPHEGGTARERFSAHAGGPCAECHQLMDPLGFPLEAYDATGQFRTTDGGLELDLTGEFVQTRAMDGPFNGPIEMAQKLAAAPEVADCVASKWFQYTMGRGLEGGDACSLIPLQDSFGGGGTNLHELMVNTTQTEAFLHRRQSAP